MRIIHFAVLGLALTGCMNTNKVPDSALADVPPEHVERLASLEQRIDDVEDRIALQKQAVDRAQDDVKNHDDRVSALEKRLDAEKDLKKTAVETGDADAAERADQNREAVEDRIDSAREERSRSAHMLRVERAKLDELQAEKAYRQAELELAQAEAVSETRDDYDVSKFRDQLEQRQLDWEQARREASELEDRGPAIAD